MWRSDVVKCTNVKPHGRSSRWRCETDLPRHLRFEDTTIVCEVSNDFHSTLASEVGFVAEECGLWPRGGIWLSEGLRIWLRRCHFGRQLRTGVQLDACWYAPCFHSLNLNVHSGTQIIARHQLSFCCHIKLWENCWTPKNFFKQFFRERLGVEGTNVGAGTRITPRRFWLAQLRIFSVELCLKCILTVLNYHITSSWNHPETWPLLGEDGCKLFLPSVWPRRYHKLAWPTSPRVVAL